MSASTSSEATARATEIEQRARALVSQFRSALIALSGGVDSSVVAVLAAQELGAKAIAVTGVSPSLPEGEIAPIKILCDRWGLRHETVATHELSRPGYVTNAPDRCYHCKTELFSVLTARARELGLEAVLDGTTAEDLTGHRPGWRAVQENAVRSPLMDAGATKADVRALARRLGLPNAERPASPCLSSRIAYGVEVTAERLARVGRAEALLRPLGFSDARVRLHGTIARIEVPHGELALAVQHGDVIARAFRELGFVYVTLDLVGLRSGSLLEEIPMAKP